MLTLINNATIVNEGRQFIGSVVIDGEFIIDVMEGAVEQTEHFDHVVDATDLYLFPQNTIPCSPLRTALYRPFAPLRVKSWPSALLA